MQRQQPAQDKGVGSVTQEAWKASHASPFGNRECFIDQGRGIRGNLWLEA